MEIFIKTFRVEFSQKIFSKKNFRILFSEKKNPNFISEKTSISKNFSLETRLTADLTLGELSEFFLVFPYHPSVSEFYLYSEILVIILKLRENQQKKKLRVYYSTPVHRQIIFPYEEV